MDVLLEIRSQSHVKQVFLINDLEINYHLKTNKIFYKHYAMKIGVFFFILNTPLIIVHLHHYLCISSVGF